MNGRKGAMSALDSRGLPPRDWRVEEIAERMEVMLDVTVPLMVRSRVGGKCAV